MVYHWMKWRIYKKYVYYVLIFIGLVTFAIFGLRYFMGTTMGQLHASIASRPPSIEKEWEAFSLYISYIPQLINLGTVDLLEQQGKPFYYLLFVDGQFVSVSEENTLDTVSAEGEKSFIWWYGTETFFDTKGLHWVQIKNDIVISELYIYEPIPISQVVKKEEIGNRYLNVSWLTVLTNLGIPETIIVEMSVREEAVLRLRYRTTTGGIFELAGDMNQVRYISDSITETTF